MAYTSIITIILVFISILIGFFLSKILNSDKEKNLSTLFISSGIGLVLSSFASLTDKIIDIINYLIGSNHIVSDNNYGSMTCGFILIAIGIYYNKNIRDRFFVLNFLSKDRRMISDINVVKDLKLSDFKLREHSIDIVRMFQDGSNITKKSSDYIVDEIEEKANCFVNQSKEFERAFTGMGAIPYSILLGTYLSSTEINEYFEYDGHKKKYYALKDKKTFKKDDFQKLDKIDLEINKKSIDVVVALSISYPVTDVALTQFDGKDIIKIGVTTPKDNIIRSKEQLSNYVTEIVKTLEALKEDYSKLETVHLVGAIPSCLSIELGRRISLRRNRLVRIISYQYISSSVPKYVWGIVVNGKDKGSLIKV
ncbi:TPA: SAVED domain-containing protein [Clostridium perfringens]